MPMIGTSLVNPEKKETEALPHLYAWGTSQENERNSLPSSTDASALPGHAPLLPLLSRVQRLISPRDFQEEVRGILDVEHLLCRCVVLLDVSETDLEEIVMRMLDERATYFGNDESDGSTVGWNQRHISFREIREKLFISNRTENVSFSAFGLREYMQGIQEGENGAMVEDQRWLLLHCSLQNMLCPRVFFARLAAPTNFGPGLAEVRFVLLLIAPLLQKETKSAVELSRTFGTLLAVPHLYHQLSIVDTERQFVDQIRRKAQKLSQNAWNGKRGEKGKKEQSELDKTREWFPGKGLARDLRRRLPFYKSDFLDGIADARAFHKTISSAAFLYFIVLPTSIALGMLNEENTHGKITARKAILGQWIGGLVFGVFGGQLFLILLTSPPISIYITVIERISHSLDYDFFQLYSGIGIWCCFYLSLFALFEASKVMKYAKRSLEELFSMFIASTLTIESLKAALRSLLSASLPHCVEGSGQFPSGSPHPPLPPPPLPPPPPPAGHPPPPPSPLDPLSCNRAVGLLFTLLMLGTAWTALRLANFRKTPFLGRHKREIISDYALPLAVLLMTLIANFAFGDIPQETFHLGGPHNDLSLGPFWRLPFRGQLICCLLGFPLSVLFAMDQMIVTETVDNSQNNLRKGPAANWDFLVVALLNVPLSLFGLPWMHAALPQSFLHLRSQADVEDRLVDGTVQQKIVKNRESRLATLLAHSLMVPTYFFALHILRRFPTSVFRGVFLFLAASSTIGNELCQRTILFFTEQRSYPPTHYIRRVPQRSVHLFTAFELLQLGLLIIIGHFPWPVIRLFFPIALIAFIPLRSFVIPRLFNKKYLEVLDGEH